MILNHERPGRAVRSYEGMNVPQGSYVYRVSATGITGKATARDGTVNIIY